MVQLDAFLDLEKIEGGADRRMLDLGVIIHHLDLRPHDPIGLVKERRKETAGNITIMVDGSRQHRSAVLAKPSRIVSSPAEEGHAVGRTANDHVQAPKPTCRSRRRDSGVISTQPPKNLLT